MKHVVVNKVVDETVQEGYVHRLSKGQAAGVEQLEQVRDYQWLCYSVTSAYERELRSPDSPEIHHAVTCRKAQTSIKSCLRVIFQLWRPSINSC